MGPIIVILLAAAAIAFVQFRLGVRAFERRLAEQATPLKDPDLAAAIRRLGALAGTPELEARLFDMPVVNALATPEGRIYLTTQLERQYRMGLLSVAEVASVVAHELGHVALGHHRRRMIDWTGQSAVRIGLGLVLNRFLPLIGFVIADLLGRAVIARLSRRDEFEADRYATALMIRAGYGPGPQISMFEKLARMVPGPQGAAWMASHPPVPERIAAIEANAAAWETA
jgi:putative metalloprotease